MRLRAGYSEGVYEGFRQHTIFAGVSYDACPGGSLLPATPISIAGARFRDGQRESSPPRDP